jgi:hypothetical protein
MWFWYPAVIAGLFGYISTCPADIMHCYRLTDRNDYDEQAIWRLVQSHGGCIDVGPKYLDFWMAAPWDHLLIMTLPNLERRPELDRH